MQKNYRAVVLRKNLSVERGEHRLFDNIVYFFYITNKRDVPVEEIVWESNERCNQENLIAQLKSGVHGARDTARQSIEQLGIHGDGVACLEPQSVVRAPTPWKRDGGRASTRPRNEPLSGWSSNRS